MFADHQYPLTAYQEIAPLCEKGHVLLVRNQEDGQLYVKKQVQCHSPELYLQLMKSPIPHTPRIFGLYDESASKDSDCAAVLTIIEEYIPGSTLAELLADGKHFSENEVIGIALGLCKILMKLHSQKPRIIHRDIKPSNVMLSSDGTVTLLDFNAAKTESTRQTRDTVLLGTAGFAAPEQYGFSASSPQTDIYGLGVLMNLLLTRSLPTEKIVSGKLNRIVRLCLQVNPKDRYQDIRELYYALKRVRRIRIQWLLPGFRSLKFYYMIPASAGYLFLLVFFLHAGWDTYKTPYELIQFLIITLSFSLINILFYGDYMGIRRYFPLMRSSKRWLRILGFVLEPAAAIFLIILVLILFEIIISL